MANTSILDALKTRVLEIKWDALLIEDNALSLGRVMGWVVFIAILIMWFRGAEPPVSMVETFWALLVYNANKKVIGPLTSYLSSRSAANNGPRFKAIPHPSEPADYERREQITPSLPLPRVPSSKVIAKASSPDRKSTVTFIDEDNGNNPFEK